MVGSTANGIGAMTHCVNDFLPLSGSLPEHGSDHTNYRDCCDEREDHEGLLCLSRHCQLLG